MCVFGALTSVPFEPVDALEHLKLWRMLWQDREPPHTLYCSHKCNGCHVTMGCDLQPGCLADCTSLMMSPRLHGLPHAGVDKIPNFEQAFVHFLRTACEEEEQQQLQPQSDDHLTRPHQPWQQPQHAQQDMQPETQQQGTLQQQQEAQQQQQQQQHSGSSQGTSTHVSTGVQQHVLAA